MRASLDQLREKDFDVVIVGGGINGAAAAQHIAAQGNDVLLVEKEDFGSGSTGRSSRLLHCGLRYLAPGRSIWTFARHPWLLVDALRMAYQAMQSRAEFVASSPERVRQMEFAFPIYRDGPYSGWQVDLAFLVLKLVGPKNPPLDYRRIPASRIRDMPLARELRNLDRLDSVAVYREYQFDWPERICMDCILDAERLGAVVRNYTSARLTSMDENGRWSLNLRDTRTGDTADVRASLVLNVAGIWIDDVNATFGADAGRRVVGTKGSHILVKLPSGHSGLGLATINSRGEPFYCIPWHDLHYFGPTETLYDGDKDDIHVTEDEQHWLLNEANRLLPGVSLSSADVCLTWAGVRPLTYDEAAPSGNRSRHLHDMSGGGMPNVLALTAGPVTSHRSTGRLLAREVAKRVKPKRAGKKPPLFARTIPRRRRFSLSCCTGGDDTGVRYPRCRERGTRADTGGRAFPPARPVLAARAPQRADRARGRDPGNGTPPVRRRNKAGDRALLRRVATSIRPQKH